MSDLKTTTPPSPAAAPAAAPVLSDDPASGGGSNTRSELFTASDIARFCQVDLKTIHNWVDKGEIRHFRTPGRHLRFRRLDVLDFLHKYDYPIPEALRIGNPKVVAVDGDPAVLAALRDALSKSFDVTTFQDPIDALIALGSLQPDAFILDVDMAGLDGIHCIERVRSIEATAFVRCIVVSANVCASKAAIDAGAYDFIKKGELGDLAQSLLAMQADQERSASGGRRSRCVSGSRKARRILDPTT